eukprot:5214888-Alexandrium_andersonii.AAC.1
MLVKSVQLGLSRCTGRAAMAESPRGRGRTPPHRLPGPPESHPQMGAVLWAKMLVHSNSGAP